MEIVLQRYNGSEDCTLGLLFVDCRFQCYTLEDEFRSVKIKGKTRIPFGRYKLELRTEGGMNADYQRRFGDSHIGMLWIKDIPNFEYVYLHIGNTEANTEGCPLVGNQVNNNSTAAGFLGDSKTAYLKLYDIVTTAMVFGDEVWIDVLDEGQLPFA